MGNDANVSYVLDGDMVERVGLGLRLGMIPPRLMRAKLKREKLAWCWAELRPPPGPMQAPR